MFSASLLDTEIDLYISPSDKHSTMSRRFKVVELKILYGTILLWTSLFTYHLAHNLIVSSLYP